MQGMSNSRQARRPSSTHSNLFDEEESVRSAHYSDEDDLEDDVSQTSNGNLSHAPAKKQNWRQVAYLSFTSLGAIYGDIGTSPLYVLSTIKYPNSPPSKKDLYGGISLIFYLFTIVVIIKYILIVLVIGPNDGEGGQVAIYAKIARHLKIGPKGVTIPGGPEKDDMTLLTRQETSLSFISLNKRMNDFKNSPRMIKIVSKVILTCCFLGCALVVSDGLLTPTTSVLSAIAGIQVAQPSFNAVLGVSEAVLVFLFLMQQLGSAKISLAFAPIIFLWLVGLFVVGVINIAKFQPGIFRALSPYYAIELLKAGGIDVIGGAMLAITGTEAMFADIGHFGRLPVQLALSMFVYPCLMITYLGQASYCVKHPDAISNSFYLSIPGGTGSGPYWIMFILATLATIIASQALILGVFSIIAQMINLDCFPKFRIVHVSKNYAGKVYIPLVNWLLLVGVCATTAGFKNSNNVTAAYGLGILIDFFVTSILVMICMLYVFEWNILIPIVFGLFFLPLEMVMIVSNVKKFVHGAWFPLLMTAVFYSFFSFWRWARSKKVEQEFASRVRIGDLYPYFRHVPIVNTVDLSGMPVAAVKKKALLADKVNESSNLLTLSAHGSTHDLNSVLDMKPPEQDGATTSHANPLTQDNDDSDELVVNSFFGDHRLKRYDGVAIMYGDAMHTLNSPNTVPQLYRLMVESFSSIPTIFIFCAVRVLSIPVVPEEERILVANMKIPGHYKCVIRFGFTEHIKIDEELLKHVLHLFPASSNLIHRTHTRGQDVPILHIFENELIRSHRFASEEDYTRNPFIWAKRYARKFLINHCFSPISNAFRSKGEILKIDETVTHQRKLFIGTVVRV